MRLAAGWGSPFPLQRGLQAQSLDILKVSWLPCLLSQTLPPPTSRMSARSPYSGPHRKLVLAFDVGTTFSGISYWPVDCNNIIERYLISWLAYSTPAKFLKSEEWLGNTFPKLYQNLSYPDNNVLVILPKNMLAEIPRSQPSFTMIKMEMLVRLVLRHFARASKTRPKSVNGQNQNGKALHLLPHRCGWPWLKF